jgi:peptide deformylase
MPYKIAQLGNPIIRSKAKAVTDILDQSIQALIDDMLTAVIEEEGVGIAAPQIFHPLRLFIMASRPNDRYPHAPEMQATAIINPKIIWKSEQMESDWEGCLSVPSIRGLVPRHNKIKVKYFTRECQLIETEYSGFLARIFQHEYDHLEGKVFIDRVVSTHDLMAESEWRSQILGGKQ